MRYKPAYIECPTGVYVLVGTIPAYMADLLFANEEIAQQALAECEAVLGGDLDAYGGFAKLWLAGVRLVSETWTLR